MAIQLFRYLNMVFSLLNRFTLNELEGWEKKDKFSA